MNGLTSRKVIWQRNLGLLFLFLVMAQGAVWAQGEASISGVVTDATGAVLVGATVKVKNVETGATRTLSTDASGHYDASLLAVGKYELTVEQDNFRTESRTGITLVLGQRAVVDIALEVGGTQQAINVEETALELAVTTADFSGLVGERQVKDLPLNGRSFDNLLTLDSGVVNFTAQRAGGIGTSASAVGNMFSVSGHRPEDNLFLLNGVEYTGASNINVTPGGASGQLLGVDAIREFAVVRDTYGAEYGKRSGAQVNIVTTSGTNLLHGSAYEFLRNSSLDARNYFDQDKKPQFQRNVFGGSLGGAIQKDKTFFFINYEGFRQHLGVSNVTLVPDDNARNGFLPCSAISPTPSPCNASTPLINVGLAARIPELLTLWPVANGPQVLTSGGLPSGIAKSFNSPLQTLREDFATSRFDHNFSDKDLFAAVYTLDDSVGNTPSTNPLSLVNLRVRNQVTSLAETHIFSPNIVNKATFGFSRASFFFTGLTPVSLTPFIQGRPIGAVTIGGSTALNSSSQLTAAGPNGNSNLGSHRNLFTATDQVSINHGIHTFNFGVWLQQLQSNDNLAANQYGQAVFTTLQTFLQGSVSSFSAIPSPTPLSFRTLEGAFYAEDIMKLTPSLELRLGFRDEFTTGWNEAYGRGPNYLFDSNGVIQTNPVVGSSVFTVNRAKFLPAPRIGVAWSPFSSKTVIRAGFGIYYSLNDALSYRLTQAAPFNSVIGLTNVTVSSISINPNLPPPSASKITPAGLQPDLATPTVISYSLKIEREITPGTTLSVGYVGSHGYHELLAIDANVPARTICPTGCPAGYPDGIVYYPTSIRANNNVANTTHWFSWGVSSYNGVQVDVVRNFSRGLQFRGSYTFAKDLDEGSSLANAISGSTNAFNQDPYNPRGDYGRSSYDIQHSLVANATYELPFGRNKGSGSNGLYHAIAGDWQVSTIVTIQSGLPFSPQLGFNPSRDGNTRNPIRPSLNPAFTGNVILGSPNKYFDTNAFIVPLPGTYGNAGRDSLEGPGLKNVDLSFAKKFSLTERLNLQFRSEIFNIFNHANLNSPNPIVFTSATSGPSSTAGLITSTTTTSRQVQFGLKLLW